MLYRMIFMVEGRLFKLVGAVLLQCISVNRNRTYMI